MARQAPIIGSFAGGEISPYMVGRTDHSRYYISCRTLENAISLPHGPVERRGGTRFIAEVKNSANRVRLLPFEFSDLQAYVLEAGPLYMRVFKDRGQVMNAAGSAVPYEFVTPYAAADLDDLWICQSNDIMWICHPKHAPRKLSRRGHTDWTLEAEEFISGPFLDENSTNTSLTAAALSGSAIQVTASAVTGINNGDGFKASDVGRLVRIGHPADAWVKSTPYAVGAVVTSSGNTYRCTTAGTSSSTVTLSGTGIGIADGSAGWKQIGSTGIGWGYGIITEIISTTQVKVDIKDSFVRLTATASWCLGLWSQTTGWPAVSTFHQERLAYGSATAARPHRIDGSRIGEFNNFTPGTNDSDPIAISIGSNKVNKVRWLASSRVLLVGTVGAEFVLSADSASTPLTPTNIQATPHTREGCAALAPVETGLAMLFVQRLGHKIHELKYDLNVDGYIAPEVTLFAEQVTRTGFTSLAWQKQPWNVVWCVCADGELAACTYLPAQDVTGWHRHQIGGDGKVESLAVIPGAAGSDEVWLSVRRTIGGVTRRYIEVLSDPLPLDGRQSDAFYVDSGLSLVNTQDLGLSYAAASGSGIPFTATAALFDADDVGREIHCDWLAMERRRGRLRPTWRKGRARITAVTGPATVTADILTGFPPDLSLAAGAWRLSVGTLSGLDHLEGCTVQILADGGVHPDRVVTGGKVVLGWQASKVHVGLTYSTVIEPMPLEVGSRVKRLANIRLRLLRSLGGQVGRDDASLEQILFRSITDPLDAPPDLFSGDKLLTFPGDWDEIGDVLMVQDLPLPFTVAAIIPDVETSNE